MGLDRDRFRNLLPESALAGKGAMVVGVGGIGSPTAILLAQMGVPRLYLVDFDKVEPPNVATQMYTEDQVGLPKVAALEETIRVVHPLCDVKALEGRFTAEMLDLPQWDVLVLSLDSIEVREQVAKAAFALNGRKARMLVDPRMGLETLEVSTVFLPRDAKREEYEAQLKDRDHADLPCGARAVAYTGCFAGIVVASLARRWWMELTVPYMVLGDAGAYGMNPVWREGQEYDGDGLP
jgi:molybdopterin/thiamine biosynthesis adenylyltransferase